MSRLTKHMRFLTPRIAARLAGNTLLTRCGVPRLRNAQLALTHKCNHNCSFCSSSDLYDAGRMPLSVLDWTRLAADLRRLGCCHFDLTGGEPTTHPALLEIVDGVAGKEDAVVSLATNGKVVDRWLLSDLRQAGLTAILFNVQSDSAEEHDALVGDPGNWAHIMDLIPAAKMVRLAVCINTCLTRSNWESVLGLVRLAEARDIMLLVNLAAPTGRMVHRDVRLTEYNCRLRLLEDASPNVRFDYSYCYRGRDLCPAGVEKLYVGAYGDVMPCTFSRRVFGNVRDEPVGNIWRRMVEEPMLSGRSGCKHTFNPEYRAWLGEGA